MKVISKVDEHTDWCSPMVMVPKANGNVRICVDLHPVEPVSNGKCIFSPMWKIYTLAHLRNGEVFSKLDANSGF